MGPDCCGPPFRLKKKRKIQLLRPVAKIRTGGHHRAVLTRASPGLQRFPLINMLRVCACAVRTSYTNCKGQAGVGEIKYLAT